MYKALLWRSVLFTIRVKYFDVVARNQCQPDLELAESATEHKIEWHLV